MYTIMMLPLDNKVIIAWDSLIVDHNHLISLWVEFIGGYFILYLKIFNPAFMLAYKYKYEAFDCTVKIKI